MSTSICPYCYQKANLIILIPCPGYGTTCKTRIKIPRGGCCMKCLQTRPDFDGMKPCNSNCEGGVR